MARARNIRIEGLDDLTQQFKKLMATAEGPALQDALLQAAEMLESEVERRAPVAPYATNRFGHVFNPGQLRKSVKSARGRKHKFFLQAYTFTIKDLAPHAYWAEFGTKSHVISGKKMRIAGRALMYSSERDNRVGDQVRTKVQHPGARPSKFFSTAIKAKRLEIKKLIEVRARAAFEAVARAA
jgi:hypothetical protein